MQYQMKTNREVSENTAATLLLIGLLVLAVMCVSIQAVFADGSSASVTVTARIVSAIYVANGSVARSNTTVIRQVEQGLVTYTVP